MGGGQRKVFADCLQIYCKFLAGVLEGWWWMAEVSPLDSAGAPLTLSFSLLHQHVFSSTKELRVGSVGFAPLFSPC